VYFIPLLSNRESSVKRVHDTDELEEACSEARDVEQEQPGEEQPVIHIRLENEPQVVQDILPSLAAIPIHIK
jgi:hypothetical protein